MKISNYEKWYLCPYELINIRIYMRKYIFAIFREMGIKKKRQYKKLIKDVRIKFEEPSFFNQEGTIINPNPLLLDSSGRVPKNIWVKSNHEIKFFLIK
jgi:hypothetical protein